MTPRRLGVLGATGRMGRLVIREIGAADDVVLRAAVAGPRDPALGTDAGVLAGTGPCGVSVSALDDGVFDGCDAVIDFSSAAALGAALGILGDTPLVTGTTGLGADLVDRLAEQAQRAPILAAANFSTGVTLLLDLVGRAAAALPDYDLEIVEAHHRFKRDAPSGTALALGRAAADARGTDLETMSQHGRHGDTGVRAEGVIGFHALRGGGIVGEHEVWLVGPGERVLLGHTAIDRATFAQGALRAARWIIGRPAGRYGLPDVLGLTPS